MCGLYLALGRAVSADKFDADLVIGLLHAALATTMRVHIVSDLAQCSKLKMAWCSTLSKAGSLCPTVLCWFKWLTQMTDPSSSADAILQTLQNETWPDKLLSWKLSNNSFIHQITVCEIQLAFALNQGKTRISRHQTDFKVWETALLAHEVGLLSDPIW